MQGQSQLVAQLQAGYAVLQDVELQDGFAFSIERIGNIGLTEEIVVNALQHDNLLHVSCNGKCLSLHDGSEDGYIPVRGKRLHPVVAQVYDASLSGCYAEFRVKTGEEFGNQALEPVEDAHYYDHGHCGNGNAHNGYQRDYVDGIVALLGEEIAV